MNTQSIRDTLGGLAQATTPTQCLGMTRSAQSGVDSGHAVCVELFSSRNDEL